jgi:phage-related protein
MAFRLEFYCTAAGIEPALEYIRAQVKAHRAKIGRALRYLEEVGHLARRPQVDYLGDSLYELRVAVDQHQHRLLYFFHGRSIIVITTGILKNQGRVPRSEIDRALKYRTDWLARFGGKG